MRTAAAMENNRALPSRKGIGSNRSVITPAIPTKEITTKIARNAKHSHCAIRRGRESGWAKPLANAANDATDSGPATLTEMLRRTYTQTQGAAKLSKAPVKTKAASHSDSSRI